MPDFFDAKKFEYIDKDKLRDFSKINNKSECYIISGFGEYDGLVMSFSEAITNPNFGASGTIVYDFTNNRLIYHEELSFGKAKTYYARHEK